jgi:gliding motility-associated-like protein
VVERSTDGQYFTVVKTLPANTTSYADKSLTPLVTYYYRVKATGTISNSSYSNVASVTTPYDMNLPLWPTSLTATTISDQEITLSWVDNSDNETGFEIQRSLNGTSYIAIDTVEASITTFTDGNLMLGTQYYYRVAGINSHGKSPFSNVATSVTTGSNQPPTINAVGNIETCVTSASTIPLTGITCGPERGQKVTLAVVSDNAALFDQLMVSSVANGEAILTYQIKAKTAGTANVTVTAKDDGGTNNGGNDTYSVSFTITASPLNVAITSDQGELVPRGSIVNLTATGGEFYEWAEGPGIQGSKNLATLTIHPMYSYTYQVKTTTSEGCTGDASITIQLNADYNVEPVNILTPNGDGRNDVWVIWNINIYKGSEVKVFDMRGIEVFRMKDYDNSWNGSYKGTPLSQGTYPYVIDLGSGFAPIKGVLTIIHEK